MPDQRKLIKKLKKSNTKDDEKLKPCIIDNGMARPLKTIEKNVKKCQKTIRKKCQVENIVCVCVCV